jgi:hypothetical protein
MTTTHTSRVTARHELDATEALVSLPLVQHALWECQTSVREEGPTGQLRVHRVPAN